MGKCNLFQANPTCKVVLCLLVILPSRYFHHMNDLGQALLKHAYREKGKYGMIHLNSRNSHYFGFSPSEQGYKSVFSEIVRQYQGYDTCNPECLTFKMC